MTLILVAAGIMILSSPTSADLIENGDFETGDLTGWTFTPGLTADPGQVAEVAMFDGSNAFRLNTGNAFLTGNDATSGGTLSQVVSVTGGVTYTISGDIAMENLGTTPTFFRNGGRISVLIDDVLISQIGDPLFGQLLGPGEILRVSYLDLFTPASTGDVEFAIEFGRRGTNTPPAVYHYADNLSIVPEPSTAGLLLVGLFGLAGLSRRLAGEGPGAEG